MSENQDTWNGDVPANDVVDEWQGKVKTYTPREPEKPPITELNIDPRQFYENRGPLQLKSEDLSKIALSTPQEIFARNEAKRLENIKAGKNQPFNEQAWIEQRPSIYKKAIDPAMDAMSKGLLPRMGEEDTGNRFLDRPLIPAFGTGVQIPSLRAFYNEVIQPQSSVANAIAIGLEGAPGLAGSIERNAARLEDLGTALRSTGRMTGELPLESTKSPLLPKFNTRTVNRLQGIPEQTAQFGLDYQEPSTYPLNIVPRRLQPPQESTNAAVWRAILPEKMQQSPLGARIQNTEPSIVHEVQRDASGRIIPAKEIPDVPEATAPELTPEEIAQENKAQERFARPGTRRIIVPITGPEDLAAKTKQAASEGLTLVNHTSKSATFTANPKAAERASALSRLGGQAGAIGDIPEIPEPSIADAFRVESGKVLGQETLENIINTARKYSQDTGYAVSGSARVAEGSGNIKDPKIRAEIRSAINDITSEGKFDLNKYATYPVKLRYPIYDQLTSPERKLYTDALNEKFGADKTPADVTAIRMLEGRSPQVAQVSPTQLEHYMGRQLKPIQDVRLAQENRSDVIAKALHEPTSAERESHVAPQQIIQDQVNRLSRKLTGARLTEAERTQKLQDFHDSLQRTYNKINEFMTPAKEFFKNTTGATDVEKNPAVKTLRKLQDWNKSRIVDPKEELPFGSPEFAGRIFAYDPKRNELVLSGPGENYHALALNQAGIRNLEQDRFTVHGRINSSSQIQVTGIHARNEVAASDAANKLFEKLKSHGATDETPITYPIGGTKSIGQRQSNFYGDEPWINTSNSLFGNQEGAVKFRLVKKEVVDRVRKGLINRMIDDVPPLKELYEPYKNDVNWKQFNQIIDDPEFLTDLNKARQEADTRTTASPVSIESLNKFSDAIAAHKAAREEQDALVSSERLKRFTAASKVPVREQKDIGKMMSLLKGKYPKVGPDLQEASQNLNVPELLQRADSHPGLDMYERVRAHKAISKALQLYGETEPLQPNEIDTLKKIFGDKIGENLADFQKGFYRDPESGFINPKMIAPLFSGPDIYRGLKDAVAFGKANLSSLDFPGLFRAGKLYVGRKSWRDAIVPAMKSYFSQNTFEDLLNQIHTNRYYRQAMDDGLAISELGSKIAKRREEGVLSLQAQKIPWVKASNRGQTAFVDLMRLNEYGTQIDRYQNYYDTAIKNAKSAQEIADLEEFNTKNPYVREKIADGINTATMRGKLPGRLEGAAEDLNVFFYAPRNLSAQIRNTNRLFNPVSWMKANRLENMDKVKQLLSLASVIGTTTAAGKYLLQAEVENRPISSDFGKIKVGDTRLDDMGGFQQILVPVMKLLTPTALNMYQGHGGFVPGASISPTTGKLSLIGDFGKQSATDLLGDYFGYKGSPMLNLGKSILTGNEFAGKPANFTTLNPLANTFMNDTMIPLIVQDAYDILTHDPSFAKAVMLVPGSVGMGVQTFNREDMINPNQKQENVRRNQERAKLKNIFGAK